MLTERLEMNNVVRTKPNVSEIMPDLFKQHHRFIAVVNQTTNSGAPDYTQLPTIAGSVNVGQTAMNFLKDNLKVSFLQASEIAGKQVANGTIVAGHLGVVRGYLVYTFFVVNTQD